jgi:hypothetical protein
MRQGPLDLKLKAHEAELDAEIAAKPRIAVALSALRQ